MVVTMILKIPLSNLVHEPRRLVGRATAVKSWSTTGFMLDEWPELVAVVEENLRYGDVNNVYRKHSEIEGPLGELIAVRYVADGLLPLHLLNN